MWLQAPDGPIPRRSTPGRAKCQECQEPISKGALRFGSESNYRGHVQMKFRHTDCVLPACDTRAATRQRRAAFPPAGHPTAGVSVRREALQWLRLPGRCAHSFRNITRGGSRTESPKRGRIFAVVRQKYPCSARLHRSRRQQKSSRRSRAGTRWATKPRSGTSSIPSCRALRPFLQLTTSTTTRWPRRGCMRTSTERLGCTPSLH